VRVGGSLAGSPPSDMHLCVIHRPPIYPLDFTNAWLVAFESALSKSHFGI